MPTIRLFRLGRHTTAAVAALALLVGTLTVASRAEATSGATFHYRGDYASALWTLGDGRNTMIAVFAAEATSQNGSGGPAASEGVTVESSQRFCDTAADQDVIRWHNGTAATTVEIDDRLVAATWGDVEVTMAGLELRWDGCGENIDWDSQTTTTVPAVTVRISGRLTSTSEVIRDHAAYMIFADPGRYVTMTTGTGREADGVVTLSTLDPDLASLLPLGTPDSAAIGRTGRVEVAIGTCGTAEGEWPHCNPQG